MDVRTEELNKAAIYRQTALEELEDEGLKRAAFCAAVNLRRLADVIHQPKRSKEEKHLVSCYLYGLCVQTMDLIGCIGWVDEEGVEHRNAV